MLQLSVSLSHAGTIAFIRSSFEHPPEVWVGPLTQMKQLTHLNDALKPVWGKTESIEWENDGFHVQGWLLYPANYDPSKKYPLLVSVHGGPSSAVSPRWPALALALLAAGAYAWDVGYAPRFLAAFVDDKLANAPKLSIVVLPFENLSGDKEQDYFADGIVEDIITALSRFKSLFVIARNSSFAYKGKAVDAKQVGRELGVRYVLEGSVRKAGERLRITGQLVDATTGAQLWAEKFDGPMADVFELQDQVASAVAGVIDPLLLDTEIQRAMQQPTSDLTAYHFYLRSLPLIRAWSPEANQEAIALL